MYDGEDDVDDIVEFEYPDESDFGASSEDIIKGDVSLLAGVIQLLIG